MDCYDTFLSRHYFSLLLLLLLDLAALIETRPHTAQLAIGYAVAFELSRCRSWTCEVPDDNVDCRGNSSCADIITNSASAASSQGHQLTLYSIPHGNSLCRKVNCYTPVRNGGCELNMFCLFGV